MRELAEGEVLSKMVLLKRIGVGGMGELWHALTPDAEGVAVKVLYAELAGDQTYRKMFLDEARIALSLSHPSIVRALGSGEDRGWCFQVYELLDGADLAKLLGPLRRARTELPMASILWIGSQVAAALAYAHVARDGAGRPLGLVHRDITPANIFVCRDGRVVVIDFGIARTKERLTRTQTGIIKGKLGYMAPEQLRGQPAAPPIDIFALGIVLWEMLALRRLFVGTSDMDVVNAIYAADVPPIEDLRDDVPPPLADLVHAMLSSEVAERPRSMAEVSDQLETLLPLGGPPLRDQLATFLATALPEPNRTAQLAPVELDAPTDVDKTLADPPCQDDEAQTIPVPLPVNQAKPAR